jgi:hypothetical protein
MTVKDSHGRAAIAGLQAQLPEDSQVRAGMVELTAQSCQDCQEEKPWQNSKRISNRTIVTG